uniref:Uncharacterized protein n=1 Tax=Romanomermis culicivorax TaxID=13658 RepID=A0A915K2S0_ROMCU
MLINNESGIQLGLRPKYEKLRPKYEKKQNTKNVKKMENTKIRKRSKNKNHKRKKRKIKINHSCTVQIEACKKA